MSDSKVIRVYDMTGIVQGVGLRPTVYALARRAGLCGWVQNRTGLVRLRLEGNADAVTEFMLRLPQNLPPHARLETVSEVVSCALPEGQCSGTFSILPSVICGTPEVVVPADLAMCADCRREVMDAADRRYGYAFSTCTRCGPRYTVVEAMPYDRERTTLAAFPLCPDCRAEYENPLDRRFHAESIACPVCGPRLSLLDVRGREVVGDPLREARATLARGGIVAVRGIGGFLLAADASNRETLRGLRSRKDRPHKALAVMAADLPTMRRCCLVPPEAARLLAAPEAPIVILDVLPEAASAGILPFDLLTPDAPDTLGVMLPTSPLHLLLLEPLSGDPVPPLKWLVMTSGNRGGEPICLTADEARVRLDGIADLFLDHDRAINLRADDSVAVVRHGAPQLWRRARGYAPNALLLHAPLQRCVLAMGAELKNSVAVGYGERVVMSPHVGDLETPEAMDSLEKVARALPRFLHKSPETVAVDLHPDMQATRLGRRLAAEYGVPVVEVQHHHAHAAAVLAEHGVESGLALVLDGTGMGPDGRIWGAELLAVDAAGYARLATFAPVPLPGGDAAVRHPARQAIARLTDAGIVPDEGILERLGVEAAAAEVWRRQCAQGINAPLTHAAGRVFDACSALLGLAPYTVTYEGQSAMRLEAAARRAAGGAINALSFELIEKDGMLTISWRKAFEALAFVDLDKINVCEWALAFHHAIASAAFSMLEYGLQNNAARVLALSGGVFMNRLLNDLLVPRLEASGLRVLLNRRVPPNDGGIALGQAAVAGKGS